MLMVAHWLQQIKKRCSACTPAPWVHDSEGFVTSAGDTGRVIGVTCKHPIDLLEVLPSAANAEFIAHSRDDVPLLVSQLERLVAGLEAIAENRASDPTRLAAELLREFRDDGRQDEDWMNRETITF